MNKNINLLNSFGSEKMMKTNITLENLDEF